MEENRDKPPWWLFQPTPSVIATAPLLVCLVIGLLLVILMPLVQWFR